MAEMDRLLLAYEAMIVATRETAGDPTDQAHSRPSRPPAASTPWTPMLQAARACRAPPATNLPPHECEGVPMSW